MKFKDLLLKIIADLHFSFSRGCCVWSSPSTEIKLHAQWSTKIPSSSHWNLSGECLALVINIHFVMLARLPLTVFPIDWFSLLDCILGSSAASSVSTTRCQLMWINLFSSLMFSFNWSVKRKVISALVMVQSIVEWNGTHLKQSGYSHRSSQQLAAECNKIPRRLWMTICNCWA